MTNNNYTISLSAIRTLYGLADMLRRVARMLEHEAETLENMVNMHIDQEMNGNERRGSAAVGNA